MKTRLIGDIHGDYTAYQDIIEGSENSIQVGDFGIGFINDDFERSSNHKFIRGNHDNPHKCKDNKFWIPDGSMHDGIFCVGGGWSIDQAWRTEGVSWWPEEELSMKEMYDVIATYESLRPTLVVSHEGPADVIRMMFHDKHILPPSRTSQMLAEMFEIHKPKLWVFGHWHLDRQMPVDDTHFVCLGINSYFDYEH